MKRIIRLTESDLTRIVRRIIKESEWTDEDEMEFQDIRSKAPNLRDFDMDVDLFEPELGKWQNDPRHVELKNKKRAYREKQEEDRYSNVVKNRPSDYDKDKYQSERDEIQSQIDDYKSKAPRLNDFDSHEDWESAFETHKAKTGISDKSKRKQELDRYLDRDRNRYGGY
jgi:hypothetical protein